jgi:hypothetical protein
VDGCYIGKSSNKDFSATLAGCYWSESAGVLERGSEGGYWRGLLQARRFPGMSRYLVVPSFLVNNSMQAELRWRLRSVYDRQEVGELLRFLLDTRAIKKKSLHSGDNGANLTMGLDDDEEKLTFWFVGDVKSWYQV